MTIREEITRLQNAKATIKTAIEGKGVAVASDAKLDAYGALVDAIQQGGGSGIPVKFFNMITGEYMATINVEEGYALQAGDFPAAGDLAETDTHPAFTFNRWTASPGEVINTPRTILACYDKVDKTTNDYYCNVYAGQRVQLGVCNGAVVDWGDGSAPETFASDGWASHAYALAGAYHVQMSGALVCNLNYRYCVCAFNAIYAGASAVVTRANYVSGANPRTSELKVLYIKDLVGAISDSSALRGAGLVAVTWKPGMAVGAEMFADCPNLLGVDLGTAAIQISNGAFRGCAALEDFTLPPDPNGLMDSIFSSCTALKHVSLPDGLAELVGFSGCTALERVEIPATVRTIKQSAFYLCAALRHVNLPAGLTTVEMAAFKGCGALASLALPSSLTAIGQSAFAGTALGALAIPSGVRFGTFGGELEDLFKLHSLTLPAELADIPASLLANAYDLGEITIPASVAAIGSKAFGFASGYEPVDGTRTVYMLSTTPPTLASADAFYAADGLRIVVPAGSLADYQSATNWTALAQYIEEAN